MLGIPVDMEGVKKLVDTTLTQIRTLLPFVFLPITFPLVFVQECYDWLKEVTGLGKRSLEEKVVLITGASSGIGESLAGLFYAAGCKLILASRRKEELERVKSQLVRSRTTGTVYVPAVVVMDLENLKALPGQCQDAVNIYGHIDILVNNAGVSYRGTVLEGDIEVDQKIMNTNYFGALVISRAVVTAMVEQHSGHVVFVNSIQGKIALPFRSAYAAAKHALQALADSLRAEVAASGVSVTVVNPGYVKTNLSLNALTGTGERYNQMDSTTEKGYLADYVAAKTFEAVRGGQKEVFICSLLHRLAVFLRVLCPRTFFYLMAWRANKFQ